MPNNGNPPKKIRITRKERTSGQIDVSKLPKQKHHVVHLSKGSSKVDLHHQRGEEKTKYRKEDVRTGDPRYGKESATKPTPDFIKKAQAAKVDVVHRDGKPYRAGHSETTKNPDKHIKIKIKPDLRMVKKTPIATPGVGGNKKEQSFGPNKKRRLERVEWLKGRNKRTESGYG